MKWNQTIISVWRDTRRIVAQANNIHTLFLLSGFFIFLFLNSFQSLEFYFEVFITRVPSSTETGLEPFYPRINKLYIKSKCIEVYEGFRTSV